MSAERHDFFGAMFGSREKAPDPTAGERGIEFPAHHIVGVDLGFTCTNCGGHTSLTPPCIPARTYPLPTSRPAVAASTGTSEDVEAPWSDERYRSLVGYLRHSIPAGQAVADLDALLAARETAARAEERERIARAIEADADRRNLLGFGISGAAMTRAAQIAREGR